jgi:hypothetical protein
MKKKKLIKKVKYLFLIPFIFFTSCYKCNTYFVGEGLKSSFLNIESELIIGNKSFINDEIQIVVNYEDLDFYNKELDSIKITPILYNENNGLDTLTQQRNMGSLYLFKIDKGVDVDEIDINVYLFTNSNSKVKDTCIKFKNLKKIENCRFNTAFH